MSQMNKKKILIIHGDAENYDELKKLLTQYPFDVLNSTNGNSGIKLAKQEKPDLILATTQLPDIDAFDLCYLIRQSPDLCTIPFILIADNINPEERINAYRSGADAFLNRNVSLREMYTVIETSIKRTQQIKNTLNAPQYSIQGKISHFSVIEILQMLHISKKSGTLNFYSKELQGKIGIWEGKLTWAEMDSLTGEEAVKTMAFWNMGHFTFEKDLIHPVKNINASTMQLILDCCQLLDEKSG